MRASRLLVSVLSVAACIALAGCGSSGSVVRAPSSSVAPSPTPSSSSPVPPSSSTSAGPRHPTVVVTPSSGLKSGQAVTVTGSGFSPAESLQVVQCAAKQASTGPGDCNLTGMLPATSDASGRVSARLTVVRGPFGANKIVCGAVQACLISVTQASLKPTEEADAPISFAAG